MELGSKDNASNEGSYTEGAVVAGTDRGREAFTEPQDQFLAAELQGLDNRRADGKAASEPGRHQSKHKQAGKPRPTQTT
jgi:hypothetical protein